MSETNYTLDGQLESRIGSDPDLYENPVEISEGNHSNLRNPFDTSDDVETSGTDEIILCLFYRKSKLAAAAYFAETSELHLMYDMTDLAPDFRLLDMLFLQLKPTQVVTSPSISDPFLRKIHSLMSGEEIPISPTIDPPSFSNKFHFIPAKEFRFTTCKRAVLELKLPSEPEHATEADRHNHVLSMINMNAPVLVSAVGGLLYFLQRSIARLSITNLQTPVLSIHTLSLKNLVWIDEETIRALQIFAPMAHPSSYKWFPGASKEGLSVFSLLNRCHSTAGAKYMRVMLSQPTRDMDVLNTRHQVIMFCLKPTNEQVVKSLTDSIVHVKTVMKILTRMTNAQASVAQWKAFYNTIYNAVLVGEVCKAHNKDVKFFQQVADCLCDSIYIMSHCINRTMDFDASAVQKRVVIKSGISDDLDQCS
ncbi:mutS protein homolog 5-like [Homalodisca vitripennis]|uniref:mutS protein homolog 5-like n=2 Tax=Homalodisca vitripennis TaxID=197043 RepID=UPI001EEB2802|nr:mutS protein homolog 5-like [Homalodisca vitripennis]